MIFNSSFVRWCIYCDSIAIICVSARFCALASISFFLPSSNVRFLSSKTIKLHRRIMNTLCYILALKSSFGSVPDKKKIPRFNLCNFSHHCNEEIKHTFLDTFTFFFLSLVCAVAKHQMGFLYAERLMLCQQRMKKKNEINSS